MPCYFFSNPMDESEIVEVVQSMSEPHIYQKNGVIWDRVWTSPQFSTSTKVDPCDHNGFVEKTGKMKGTYGDLMDYAGELSEKRAEIFGEDPVKRKHYDDYEKKTGKKHLTDKKESLGNGDVSFSDIHED